MHWFFSISNDTFSTWSKLRHLQMAKYMCFGKGTKHFGKGRKCWLPAFSPFPTIFLTGSLCRGIKSRYCVLPAFLPFPRMFSNGSFCRVVKSQECVVES